MTTFGVTSTGFVRKRLDDIRASLRASPAFDGFNTDADSRAAQLIDVFAGALADVWEGLESVYNGFDPDAASGVPLETIASYYRLARIPAQPSSGLVRVIGTTGTTIPAGYTLRAPALDLTARTTDDATIGSGGFVDVNARLVENGPIAVPAGAISTSDFLSGVDSVTNLAAFTLGRDVENDESLRERIATAPLNGANAVDRSIRAQLLELPFVAQALVVSNRGETTDANGFPAKSLNAVVWPATASASERAAIADVLVRSAPAGIRVNGAILFDVSDEDGFSPDPIPYGFSFATERDVNVRIDLTTDADYPSDGDAQVRQAIVAYGNTLRIGEPVQLFRLLCAVANTVRGIASIEGVYARLDLPATPADNVNIVVNPLEIARFDAGNIVVNS